MGKDNTETFGEERDASQGMSKILRLAITGNSTSKTVEREGVVGSG